MAYEVGQIVYITGGQYGQNWAREATVTEVTKAGNIKVLRDDGRSTTFLPSGRERGGDRFHAASLVNRETFDRAKALETQQRTIARAAKALRLVATYSVNKANKDALTVALKDALKAVEAL